MATYKPYSFPSITYPAITEGTFHITRPVHHVVVDGHPHDRVPPEILHDLLTPKLTAKGTVAARQPKDEERHFWVAQLIFYGLPHPGTIDREGARDIIQKALKEKDGAWVLPVPRSVKEVEGRLGKAAIKPFEGTVTHLGPSVNGSSDIPGGTAAVGPTPTSTPKVEKSKSGSTAAVALKETAPKKKKSDEAGNADAPGKKKAKVETQKREVSPPAVSILVEGYNDDTNV